VLLACQVLSKKCKETLYRPKHCLTYHHRLFIIIFILFFTCLPSVQ